MTLTQDASIGDTVIFVNCYVDGLQEGSIININGATYKVAARATPPGRRVIRPGMSEPWRIAFSERPITSQRTEPMHRISGVLVMRRF